MIERLREICLSLPEATEELFGGHTTSTWRVRGKIFAMLQDERGDTGKPAVWCKAAPGAQEVLMEVAPDRFFRPPYVGPKGWVGVMLNADTDWDELSELIVESFRMVAPKRVAARLDEDAGGESR